MSKYEDYTKYEEFDPHDRITVTSNKITWTVETDSVPSRVDKNFGSSHFGNLKHTFDAQHTSNTSLVDDYYGVWAINDNKASLWVMDTSNNGISLMFYTAAAGGLNLVIRDYTNDNNDTSIGLTEGATYYLTITRNQTNINCRIYSDANRSTLVDTITIVCGIQKYSNVFNFINTEVEAGLIFTGFSQNLDLHEIGGGGLNMNCGLGFRNKAKLGRIHTDAGLGMQRHSHSRVY